MRISSSATPGLLVALALAVSLSGFAQSKSQSNSSPSQSQPSQSQPSQSQPPQAAPSTPPSGQQSAPPNQASGQQQGSEDNPLNLTDDQKAKLRPIIMEENQQMEALRNDTTMTQEQKIAKANQIRADASPKIKAILTPEQIQKLSQLQEERARQQQQQSPPPPQSAPPANSQQPPK